MTLPGNLGSDGLGDRGETPAGSGWGHLADDPLDLGVALASQFHRIEGEQSREQLAKEDAQRVDVGPSVDVYRTQLGLLRAHVFGRAHEPARLGEEDLAGQRVLDCLGDAEVDDLRERAGRR
jgi:hypothetical protein